MAGMLEGKAILVTGAAGGIGRAASRLFAREGARLVVADLSEEGAVETARMVEDDGGEAIPVRVDITNSDSVGAMTAQVVDAYGRIDGAFNNAGTNGAQNGQGGKFLADWDDDAFDRVVAINLKGTFLCMKAQIRRMIEQGSGSIVNVSSLAGLTGFPTAGGYAGSKHGVIGLTRTAAIEYAPALRVNVLCPGFTDTAMLKDPMERRGDKILSGIPFGRLGTPEEMAELVCWLLSDRASYASGQAIAIDGACMAD